MTAPDVILRSDAVDTATTAFVEFLTAEFPEWRFDIESSESWSGDVRPLWIATREGHHPQSALTAGKLHRRLSDYEARIAARGGRTPDAN